MPSHVSQRNGHSDAPRLLLKPREAADALAVSERTLWTFTQRGDIPCVRFGRSVRYDPADLRRWIEQQKAADTE